MNQGKIVIYVGSWGNQEQRGHGQGISVFGLDERTGAFEYISSLQSVEEPGTLAVSPNGRFLYCANEMTVFPDGEYASGGGVSAMSIDGTTGSLRLINRKSSLGSLPAYITVDPSGQYVCCSNHASFAVISEYRKNKEGNYECKKKYDSSGIALFKVKEDGSISDGSDLMLFDEPGAYHQYKDNMELADHHFPGRRIEPAQIFQSGPHAHSINFNKEGVGVVCDRGTDMLHLVRINEKAQCFEKIFSLHTRIGIAPRHLAFHPALPCFYVTNELESSVSVYSAGLGVTVSMRPMWSSEPASTTLGAVKRRGCTRTRKEIGT